MFFIPCKVLRPIDHERAKPDEAGKRPSVVIFGHIVLVEGAAMAMPRISPPLSQPSQIKLPAVFLFEREASVSDSVESYFHKRKR